jgi:hypothetical protein
MASHDFYTDDDTGSRLAVILAGLSVSELPAEVIFRSSGTTNYKREKK